MSSRVAIFWDYSSCLNGDTRNWSRIALLLREECAQHGDIALFKTYFGLSGSAPSINLRSDIQEMGITVVDRPRAGFGAFATDVFCFLFDHHDLLASTMIVLASSNPGIGYLVYALHARGAKIGLISPSSLSNKLAPQTSWAKDWENFTAAAGLPGAVNLLNDASPSMDSPAASTSSVPSRRGYKFVGGAPSTRDSHTKNAPLIPFTASETKLETAETLQAVLPANATPPPRKVTYKITKETIPEPIRTGINNPYLERDIHTTSHKLQMFEDDPLYIQLVMDPEAVKIKTWRRKLKQLFFYENLRTNPHLPSELDTLLTSLEQYDKMTKNYLAFSKISKLLTQMSHAYINAVDYRQTYVTRAEELVKKWEPLVRSPND